MRIIIFTGYGGSGVTTLAAATAVAVGDKGLRALAFSMNPGLGRAFDAGVGDEPAEVAAGVWAVESRRRRGAEDELQGWLEDLLDWRGMDDVLAEDVASLPGINHVGRLLDLERYVASGEYDVIVLDAAPATQFLELPPALDAASRWLQRLFAPREQTLFEPFLRAFAGDYAATGEDVMERGRALLSRLARLREVLTDASSSTVRIVAAAEEGAAERLQDSLTAFHLYSYATDAAVLSRLLPAEGAGDFFAETLRVQEEVAASVGSSLGVPVLRKPLMKAPPRGPALLSEIAASVYGDLAPEDVLHQTRPRHVFHENGRFEMRLSLPYAAKDDLALEQIDDSVIVYMRDHRCVLLIPEEVRSWQAASWAFDDQTLTVTFRP